MGTYWTGACCFILLVSGCGQSAETNDAESSKNPIFNGLSASGPEPCEHGGISTGDEVSIKGESPLYDAPDGNRVVNEKATAALGKTHYQQVDNSERLKEVCRTQKWSKVQVLEPSWLTDVVGWVPVSALRSIELDAGGARRYVAADFTWDKDTESHKARLVAAVNRIARENANCASIDPGTLAKSPSRSKAGKPVFFITCNSPKGQPFNVWFEPTDAERGKSFAAIRNIDRATAVQQCEQAARMAANNPQTVDFSRFLDVAFLTYPNGRSRLLSTFSAKNAFGVEGKFNIGCLFDGSQLIETNISEGR
jgi:hypothetical protein